MRKLLVVVVASCALVAVVPASALAHGRHHRHHARVHHKTFGSDFNQSGSTSPSTTSGDTAGTVQSFTNGTLTILLTNGSTVSGQVTNATEIECRAPDTSGTSGSSGWQGHDHGGDNSSGNNGNGNDQGDDQGQGDDEHGGTSCDSSALTQGAVVREAEMSVSSAGAVWQKIELVTQSTSSSTGDNDNDGD